MASTISPPFYAISREINTSIQQFYHLQISIVILFTTELPAFSASMPPNLKNFHAAISLVSSRQLPVTPIVKAFSISTPLFPTLASTTVIAEAFAVASALLAPIFAFAILILKTFAIPIPKPLIFAFAILFSALSAMTRENTAIAGYSSWGEKGSRRKRKSQSGRVAQKGRNKSAPIPIRLTENNQEHIEKVNDADDEEKPRRRLQNRNITSYEKLVVI